MGGHVWVASPFAREKGTVSGLLVYLARRLRAPHPSPLAFSKGRSEKYWSASFEIEVVFDTIAQAWSSQ